MIDSFLVALFLSLGLILPLGAQNLFVFQQGISQTKLRHTLPTVLTASICDTVLILLAVLFGTFLVTIIPSIVTILMVAGILFIVFIGYQLWTKSAKATEGKLVLDWKVQISAAASISIFNPHAWLDTFGVIGTQATYFENVEKIIFTITCMAVSWLWFFMLAFLGSMFKLLKLLKYMTLLNRASAIILWIIALRMLLSLWGS